MKYIAFDSHKHYTYASVEDKETGEIVDKKIWHERGSLTEFLLEYEEGSPVAVETLGSWYWIVDEIESAGMEARLVNARQAKLMLRSSKKTDKLDAHGLNKLQRAGTLPTVWIPNKELRDKRELYRTRMVFSRQRTRIKNRIHSTLAKYGIRPEGVKDIFSQKGRAAIESILHLLPDQTRFSFEELLEEIDFIEEHIASFEERMAEIFDEDENVRLLRTIPGVGEILSVVIANEVGDVSRFPSAAHLAAYAGTTPSVHESGGKRRYGRTSPNTNHYLKWAFAEAANSIVRSRSNPRSRHAVDLYDRVCAKKGHSVAIGALSRHLAEATYCILKKREPYRWPLQKKAVSSTSDLSATMSWV